MKWNINLERIAQVADVHGHATESGKVIILCAIVERLEALTEAIEDLNKDTNENLDRISTTLEQLEGGR